jgi:hypothetical protein
MPVSASAGPAAKLGHLLRAEWGSGLTGRRGRGNFVENAVEKFLCQLQSLGRCQRGEVKIFNGKTHLIPRIARCTDGSMRQFSGQINKIYDSAFGPGLWCAYWRGQSEAEANHRENRYGLGLYDWKKLARAMDKPVLAFLYTASSVWRSSIAHVVPRCYVDDSHVKQTVMLIDRL